MGTPNTPTTEHRRPRVVIIGGGFGGLNAARALRRAPVDVLVLDRTNHHVFQPLLYQAATGTVAEGDIAAPIRWILRHQRNARVLLADVRDIDVTRRTVFVDDARTPIEYDYLIVASGARHSYFGHDDWEANAPGLKSIADALEIRRRFLLSFELAEKTDDLAERQALQTIVIVGGGPTGVELAGLIPEISQHALRKDFRRIDSTKTRVVLIEGGPRLLPAMPESLSRRAERDLRDLGVDVRTNSIVTSVDADAVHIGDERIVTRTVFWAAGNAASPLGRSLGTPIDRAGRVLVDPTLTVPGHPEVFVIGDLAAITRENGKLVPGVAPAAMQQGRAAARNVIRAVRGEPLKPFHYLNKGDLATIGRNKAVADFGFLRVTGIIAWLMWLFIHIMYLVGFRNRLSVLLQWAYAYFTFQRGVRLVAESNPHPGAAVASGATAVATGPHPPSRAA